MTAGAQSLSILIFHRVVSERDVMRPSEPTVAEFDWQMRHLRRSYNPMPLLEAVQALGNRSLPNRAVCVTFDDGYADNARIALPVLKKYAIPATVFISTGFINGGRMWNDTVIEALRGFEGSQLDLQSLQLGCYPTATQAERLAAVDGILTAIKHLDPEKRAERVAGIAALADSLPDNLMLTDAQLRQLADADIDIGAHTVNHPILTSIDEDLASREIEQSKHTLEHIVQRDVRVFAYPNGRPQLDYSTVHRDMVAAAGFEAAVSTHWGVAVPASDRFQLPRFTPWDRKPLAFAARLALNLRNRDPLARSTALS
ncbi:MAG: polysaccharide deacetylase family protein [Pseudomonadota bacterium]